MLNWVEGKHLADTESYATCYTTETGFTCTLLLGIQPLEELEPKYFSSHIPHKAIRRQREGQAVERLSWVVRNCKISVTILNNYVANRENIGCVL